MRILLQFPEGLKQKAAELAKSYEKEGHEVILSASACYGACDLALDEARWLDAEKIVHFGHNRFVQGKLPIEVEYVEYRIDIDVDGMKALLPLLEGKRSVALATTIQHVHQLAEMRAFLERNGKAVLVGHGERAKEEGQILGCDAGAIKKVEKDADAVVFVGEGNFHPLAIDSDKPAFAYNPSSGSARDIGPDIDRLRKRRKGAIAAALSCRRYGILISTKPGQINMPIAQWAKKELEKRGLEAQILAANELEPMAVKNFMSFDCLINTACPRMADDSEEFGKPLLNPEMLIELLRLLDSK